ncbi:MAG: hypothetical protein AB1426_11275 [Bacillota bacterium]
MQPKLSYSDLAFIVRTVATKRQDYENIVAIVKDKPDLLEIMLDDPKLFQRIMNEEEVLLRISPYLLFDILLRQARRELQTRTYTYEKTAIRWKVPVFDGLQVGDLMANPRIRSYLAGMLASFTRTQTATVYYKIGSRLYKRRYSDLSIDDLRELARLVDQGQRFLLHKRIGDVCLFLTALFPEYIEQADTYPFSKAQRPVFLPRKPRSIDNYVAEGRKFYRLAAEDQKVRGSELETVFRTLAESFALARKPLMHIADRYLSFKKFDLFSA